MWAMVCQLRCLSWLRNRSSSLVSCGLVIATRPMKFGTHSLRKTWSYYARLQGVDLAPIMHQLSRSSLTYTKRYLGIKDDELRAVVQRLNLWASHAGIVLFDTPIYK